MNFNCKFDVRKLVAAETDIQWVGLIKRQRKALKSIVSFVGPVRDQNVNLGRRRHINLKRFTEAAI